MSFSSALSSPSAVCPAREARLANEICAAGFYRFGHLSFYPERSARDLGLGSFEELLAHQKEVLNR